MAVECADVESTVFEVVDELLDSIDGDFEGELFPQMRLIADAGFSSIDFVQMTV